jgi:outer membrane receptor protein involved in Fe transport
MMKMNHTGGAAATTASFFPVIFLLSATALAQDDAADEALEEIVVTGSHIEGLSVESLPVSVMGSDEIRDLGAPSMFDLVGYIPSVGDFEFEDSSNGTNAARGDVAGVNLRGIGTGNTLLLLNGRRMVVNPTFQPINSVPSTFYNANAIPGSSVKRIEVLRDGASAIYGADASAGVMNIITRGAEDGFRISGKFASGDTSYGESEITGGGGWTVNSGKTEIGVFASYYERSYVHMNELDDLYFNLNRRGSTRIPEEWRNDSQLDNRSSLTPWARVSVGALNADNQFIGSTMHVEPATPNSLVAGSGSERYNFNDTAWITPEVERANIFASVEHDLASGMQFFGDAFYYNSTSNTQRAASPLDDSLAFLIVPGDAFYAPPEALGQDILLIGWRPIDLGPRVIEVEKDNYRLMAGLRGEFGRSWSWESALLYSQAEDTDTEGNRQAKSLFTDQISVNGPDALNPFGGPTGNTQAALAGIRIDATDVRTSKLTLWDFRLNRSDLFNAPGGAVGFATGVEVRKDEYDEDRDARLDGSMPFDNGAIFDESDVIGVSATFDSKASRTTTGVYGELFIPLVGEANAKSFTNALEVSLAVRYENTSDFGSATKPKIGVRWEIAGGFALRASYSEGFRAPNLPQMNQGTIVRRIDGVDDPWRSDVTGLPIDTGDTYRKTTRIANDQLEAEDTETSMFGAVYAPADGPMAGFRATVDFFNIKQDGVVGILTASNALDLDFLLRSTGAGTNPDVERAPVTAADQAAFDAWNLANPTDQRVAAGEATNVSNMYMNLDPREVEGWDALIEYSTPDTRAGEFRFRAEATKITKFEQLGLATTDLLRRNGNPEMRATASINWRKGGFNANASMRFVDDVYDSSLYATGPDFEGTYDPALNRTYWDVDDWTVYNLALGYDFADATGGWAQGLSLTAGVRNLTDEEPPFADESFGHLTRLHNSYGRVLWGQLTYQF